MVVIADSSDPAKKVPETKLDKPKNRKLGRENARNVQKSENEQKIDT